jgi:hypothetical protein
VAAVQSGPNCTPPPTITIKKTITGLVRVYFINKNILRAQHQQKRVVRRFLGGTSTCVSQRLTYPREVPRILGLEPLVKWIKVQEHNARPHGWMLVRWTLAVLLRKVRVTYAAHTVLSIFRVSLTYGCLCCYRLCEKRRCKIQVTS